MAPGAQFSEDGREPEKEEEDVQDRTKMLYSVLYHCLVSELRCRLCGPILVLLLRW